MYGNLGDRGRVQPLKSELLTKQACRDELVVYSLFFSPTTYIYIYIYIYIYNCRQYCFGLLGLISAVLMQ